MSDEDLAQQTLRPRSTIELSKMVNVYVSPLPIDREPLSHEITRFIKTCEIVQKKAQACEYGELLYLYETKVNCETYSLISYRDIQDFQSLKSLLLRRYTKQRGFHELFDNLQECVRATDEDLLSFLHRFDDVYRELTYYVQERDGIRMYESEAIYYLTYNVKHTTISFYLSSNRDRPYEELMLNVEQIARDESLHRTIFSRMNQRLTHQTIGDTLCDTLDDKHSSIVNSKPVTNTLCETNGQDQTLAR